MKRILTNRIDALPALTETFREHGFEGASLAVLTKATGLGKGSLYNFFPGGKEEMMDAVLKDIDQWFATSIFAQLEQTCDPPAAIVSMMEGVTAYFQSGGRACLVGWISLGSHRDAFAGRVNSYFARWISALARCLVAGDVPSLQATQMAEETVSGVQGAIILSRAMGEEAAFTRVVRCHEARLLKTIARHRASPVKGLARINE